MDKPLLVFLIFVVGLIIFGIMVIQYAEGEKIEYITFEDCRMERIPSVCASNMIVEYLIEQLKLILEELREQTELDKQRNCLIAHTSQVHTYGKNKYDLHALEKICRPIYGNSLRWEN